MTKINITITGSEFHKNTEIMDGTKIKGKVLVPEVKIDQTKFLGDLKLLNNLEMEEVVDSLQEKISTIDKNSSEYSSLLSILNTDRSNKKVLLQKVKEHIITFSEGVLAGIVSGLLTK